jgi:hypothetical protein
VTAIALALAAALVALVVLTGRQLSAAKAALVRAAAPHQLPELGPAVRRAARRHRLGCAGRGLIGYARAAAPSLTVILVAGAASWLLARLWGGPAGAVAQWVLPGGGLLAAAAAAVVAVLVVVEIGTGSGPDRPQRGGLMRLVVPIDPADFTAELTVRARAEFAAASRDRQQCAQQAALDAAAVEAARVLGRVVELPPEDLRTRVARQLALWHPSAGIAGPAGEQALRELLGQVDALLEQLEQELADGVPAAVAHEFWYTAVLRTLRHMAGPRALAGVAEAEQGQGGGAVIPGRRRRASAAAERAPAEERAGAAVGPGRSASPPVPEPEPDAASAVTVPVPESTVEGVIDLRRMDRRRGRRPTETPPRRHEA